MCKKLKKMEAAAKGLDFIIATQLKDKIIFLNKQV